MPVLMISYDLSPEGKSAYRLVKAIKTYPWAKLTTTSYAIYTDLPVQTIFNQLRPLIDGSCNLYIMTMRKPYAGYGPEEVNEWLEKYS
jgi:hypothetical protein